MIALTPSPDDDHDFVASVARLVAGSVAVHRPEQVWIHKIDYWFDHKWLEFSGKAVGALGIWSKAPTIPPFVSNRIVGKWHYRPSEVKGDYQLSESEKDIHHQGWSAENLLRRARTVAPAAALYWYSGNTLATGRGSLMGYIPAEQKYGNWFMAFTRDGEWAVSHRKNIHDYEVRLFESKAVGVLVDNPPTPQPE